MWFQGHGLRLQFYGETLRLALPAQIQDKIQVLVFKGVHVEVEVLAQRDLALADGEGLGKDLGQPPGHMRGVGIALDLVAKDGELGFLQEGDRVHFTETGPDALARLSQYLVAAVAVDAVAGVPQAVEIEGQQRRQVAVAFFLRPGLPEAVVQQTVGGQFGRRVIHGVGLAVITQRPFQASGDGAGHVGADLGIVLDQADEQFLRNSEDDERGIRPHGGGARCVAEQGQLAE